MTRLYHHRWKVSGLALVLWWLFCLPRPLFDVPYSVVIEDKVGNLLGAKIATDGQWRFPPPSTLPQNYIDALTVFEDKRFRYHPGIDPIAILRASKLNLQHGRTISGGSTLSMQVMRLARKSRQRNLWQKSLEALMALRLELTHSKSEILTLYAAHAPFGGNVVGLDAAAWRYFGKKSYNLSWAEAATLAVLPNAPALIHPGKNTAVLLDKRNRLLARLHQNKHIDQQTFLLATQEPLPSAPHPLPSLAPHLLQLAARQLAPRPTQTTIDAALQQKVLHILSRRHAVQAAAGIHNMAVLVIDVKRNIVLAYAGNAPKAGSMHHEDVDIITAARSSGSILKPILYALALQDGLILPNAMLSDVPLQLKDYQPENFTLRYEGIVPASKALSRSLNVPFVNLLQHYGVERFHFQLNKLGFSTIRRAAAHYGLSLILGGAETSLWDVTNCYAAMARTLNNFGPLSGKYQFLDAQKATFIHQEEQDKGHITEEPPLLSAAACWLAFESMRHLERPDELGQWESFGSGQPVAWKTGTSFGFRDAWAIGVNADYAVGVWVGNADGEGRPGLIGAQVAAPVLFDIFQLFPTAPWFAPPYDNLTRVSVCKHSGYRPLTFCPTTTVWSTKASIEGPACPWHELVLVDSSRRWRVHAGCEPEHQLLSLPWFVLPPLEEYYYRQRNNSYQALPPLRPDCEINAGDMPMQLVYPRRAARILVPRNLNGKLSKTTFTVAHRDPKAEIHWHIDADFISTTQGVHTFSFQPAPGKHQLTLVDHQGFRLQHRFEIIPGK
jgi:penicillin-binding protein 1C